MFIISSLIVAAIIAMTFWMGGAFSLYFNLPSLMIVAVPAFLAPFVFTTKNSVAQAFNMLIDTTSLHNCKAPSSSVEVFNVIGKTAMLMGWFGIVSGVISIASNIAPESFASTIGPAIAVLSMTLLYALIIKTFCYLATLRILSGTKTPLASTTGDALAKFDTTPS